MKKSELKQVLRPLIKECIKEVIFEEGVLSNIVAEVAQGLGGQTIVESRQSVAQERSVSQDRQQDEQRQQEAELAREKMRETRKRMLEAVGSDSYNGVDLFAGTTPTAAPVESKQGDPLAGVDPGDSGIDISRLFGGINKTWTGTVK